MNNQNTQLINSPKKEFILMMAVLMSVVALSIDAMLPALSLIGESLGVADQNQAQYIISFIFIGMATGQLMSGPLSDSIGRKKVLYLSLSVYLVGSVICILSQTLDVMLIGRLVQGLAVSGPYVCCMSIIRDRFSGRLMAKVMSLVTMVFIMIPAIAPAIGQGIVMVSSWRYIFALYIFYAIGVGVWIAFRLKETLKVEDKIPFSVISILKNAKIVITNRQTINYTICLGFIFGAMIGYLNSIPQIFSIQFGVGKMFVVYFGLQALAFGSSSLLNSRLVEKLGMLYICQRAIFIMSLSSVIFLVIYSYIEVEFWMFFTYGLIALFCVGLLFGNLNALALEPMGHQAGTASAIIGSLSSTISIILGTLIGQLYDGTLFPLLLGFSILPFLAWLIIVGNKYLFSK